MSKQTKYFDITTDRTYGFCLFVCMFVCRAKMFKLSMTALKKIDVNQLYQHLYIKVNNYL